MKAADRRRLRRARMAALGLTPPLGTPARPASALSVVRELGAVQAQDYGSGVWSLGVRSGLTPAQVEQAVIDREIVRTWPMRGTIHWVAAADARWMCRLLATARIRSLAGRYRQLGLTERDIALAGELFETHLGTPMSRPDAVALLEAHGIDPSDQRAYHLVGHHCMTGLLCQGPLIGKAPSFVLIDAWVPRSLTPTREEAMATVVERYVRGHGPVTENDVARWMLQPLGFTREALAMVEPRLVRETIDDRVWLTHADRQSSPGERVALRTGDVHLLPQWDELLLGYTSRELLLSPDYVARVVPGSNMVFSPTLVVDGEVVGTWKRVARSTHVAVEVTPFVKLAASRLRQLEDAAAAYGRFLGRDVEVCLSSTEG
ncbi:MAG: winged helix DNA-binding domain-containing protein [Terracoccus sp.]